MARDRTSVSPRAGAAGFVLAGVASLLLSGCGNSGSAVRSGPPEVRTIAREDGPPPPGRFAAEPFSQLRLVPDDGIDAVLSEYEQLPVRDGLPVERGVYGSAEDIQSSEVLAVWYSGDSGSCPSFLRGLRVTTDEADIDVAATGGDECTADYNSYQQLVVLNRVDLPDLADLPVVIYGDEGNKADDVVVDVYSAP